MHLPSKGRQLILSNRLQIWYKQKLVFLQYVKRVRSIDSKNICPLFGGFPLQLWLLWS